MSYDTIEVQHTPAGVGIVWLNRPDVRNAFNEAMIAELPKKDAPMPAMPGGGMGGMDF